MAELTVAKLLQPSLLDRLTDDQPTSRAEARERRGTTIEMLRAAVLRDLSWLLNTDNHESVRDLTPYPEVATSVINYGIPVLSGHSSSGLDLPEMERGMRRAILAFEPRLLPDTVKVKASYSGDNSTRNTLQFEIEGDLWAQPLPLRLSVETEFDLETGEVAIRERSQH